MSDVTFLLDAPELPVSEIQIAKLGSYKDARYGDFAITEGDVAAWAKNLEKLPGGKALIDFDHLSDKPSPHRRTEAAGWLTGITLQDGIPTGKIEWTPKGRSAIEEGRYRFFSPAYGDFRDESGTVHENVLTGGALSNKPFIGSMSQVTLASDENVKGALADDPASGLYQLALDGSLGEDVKTLAGVTQDERDKAHAEGNSLDDKSYPIRNVGQLKAAITLAQSGHGDVAAAKKLIQRRAKELGREDLLPDGWGDGKTLDDAPPETTELLERNAAELIDSDSETTMRVLKALETVLGATFMDAESRWHAGAQRVNQQANVAELLEAAGLDREQISQVAATVAILEANAAAERQQITDAAPLAERDRLYQGQLDGVVEPVYLPEGFDTGPLANPEERRRRLELARRHAPQGSYVGKEGAEKFHDKDNEWVELGLDYPRSLERGTEIRRARVIMKNETGGVGRPLAATTAARGEAHTLESDIADIDKRVVAEDAERAELKRRGVARGGLDPHSGNLLALRREKTIALDDLRQSRAIRLENIPGFKIALEQPTGWKKLLASELAGAGPAAPLDQAGIVAERQEIDRRAQKYLLDHNMPAENYLQALEAVGADRDRPSPVTSSSFTRRPVDTAQDDEPGGQFDREAKQLMLENEGMGFIEALKTVMGEG
jgi:hypothetical protein